MVLYLLTIEALHFKYSFLTTKKMKSSGKIYQEKQLSIGIEMKSFYLRNVYE
jgi:hypothetical protein